MRGGRWSTGLAGMRILVLGGTAWLGRTTAQTARDLGHQVVCLARGSAPFPAGVEAVRGDRGDGAAYRALTGDFDRVVDVARHPGQVRSAVTALRDRSDTYVFVSTGNVYADHSIPGQTEDSPLLPPLDDDEMTSMELYGQAKVACELAVAQAFPGRHVLARAGLIGGPGDSSGRSVYWPWRFAHPSRPDGRVLVPETTDVPTQVVDVRDLATWLVTTEGSGAFNVVGDVLPLGEHLATARGVAGHTGPLVTVTTDWLTANEVTPWAGPRSLPLWLPMPGWEGFAARGNARARAAGLELRPLADSLRDGLALVKDDERGWSAGLSDEDERDLLSRVGR